MSSNKKPAVLRSAWLLSLLLGLTALAGGCAADNSSHVVAPRPLAYAETVQQRAAEELAALGAPCPRDSLTEGCSAVHRLVIDYGNLRGQLRALHGEADDGE